MIIDVRHLIYQKRFISVQECQWVDNVPDGMSVSSSVVFLLIEGSVPVEDCTPTVISLQYNIYIHVCNSMNNDRSTSVLH